MYIYIYIYKCIIFVYIYYICITYIYNNIYIYIYTIETMDHCFKCFLYLTCNPYSQIIQSGLTLVCGLCVR